MSSQQTWRGGGPDLFLIIRKMRQDYNNYIQAFREKDPFMGTRRKTLFQESGQQRDQSEAGVLSRRLAALPRWAVESFVWAASACKLKPRAAMTLRIVSKPGLLSPESAL